MILNGVDIPEQAVADVCRRHQIRRLALFGSILGDRFTSISDVDVLVEFVPGQGPSLLGFAGIQIELSEVIGRQVHLHTAAMLSPRWRDRVREQARVQYAA